MTRLIKYEAAGQINDPKKMDKLICNNCYKKKIHVIKDDYLQIKGDYRAT